MQVWIFSRLGESCAAEAEAEDEEGDEEEAAEGGEGQSKSSQFCRQLHNKFDLHNFMLLCFLIKELIKLRAEEVVELLRVSTLCEPLSTLACLSTLFLSLSTLGEPLNSWRVSQLFLLVSQLFFFASLSQLFPSLSQLLRVSQLLVSLSSLDKPLNSFLLECQLFFLVSELSLSLSLS